MRRINKRRISKKTDRQTDMAAELTPIVFWGQKNDHISLKVDLRDATVCILIPLTFNALFSVKLARRKLLVEVQFQG